MWTITIKYIFLAGLFESTFHYSHLVLPMHANLSYNTPSNISTSHSPQALPLPYVIYSYYRNISIVTSLARSVSFYTTHPPSHSHTHSIYSVTRRSLQWSKINNSVYMTDSTIIHPLYINFFLGKQIDARSALRIFILEYRGPIHKEIK